MPTWVASLVLVLEIVGADHAGLLHAVGERLFAVDMLAAVHRPVGDEGVRMIGGAADHRLDVLLVEALPPVHVLLGAGELLRPKGQVLLVDVAQGDDVFLGEAVEVGFAPAPGADEGDIQLVAGGVGAEEPGAREDEPCGSGEGDGPEEVASFHGASLAAREARRQASSRENGCRHGIRRPKSETRNKPKRRKGEEI